MAKSKSGQLYVRVLVPFFIRIERQTYNSDLRKTWRASMLRTLDTRKTVHIQLPSLQTNAEYTHWYSVSGPHATVVQLSGSSQLHWGMTAVSMHKGQIKVKHVAELCHTTPYFKLHICAVTHTSRWAQHRSINIRSVQQLTILQPPAIAPPHGILPLGIIFTPPTEGHWKEGSKMSTRI